MLSRTRRARRGSPAIARAAVIETSVNEARWLLWPAFGLWIAFFAAGILFG
jgi:hypothetical protein